MKYQKSKEFSTGNNILETCFNHDKDLNLIISSVKVVYTKLDWTKYLYYSCSLTIFQVALTVKVMNLVKKHYTAETQNSHFFYPIQPF